MKKRYIVRPNSFIPPRIIRRLARIAARMEPRFRRVTRDDSFDRRRIEEALRKTKGNLFDAARHLRISCAALARKIRRFGLEG